MKKYKLRPIVKYIIIGLLSIVFIYSITKIIIFFKDLNSGEKDKEDLIKEVIQVINNPVIDNSKEEKPKTIFRVDFTKLTRINSDTVAWIKMNGEKINNPIVQTTDNSYYLNRSFQKKDNQIGTIFMDYRNTSLDDKNVILFGHANKVMFGSLSDLFKKGYFDDKKNNFIEIYNKNNEKLTYQIFSYYIIEKEEYYITPSFSNNTEFYNFISTLSKRSYKKFDIELTGEDHILTLSTCSGSGGTSKRRVVHAKLIDKSVDK